MFLKQSSNKEHCNGAWNTEKKIADGGKALGGGLLLTAQVNCSAFKILKKHKVKAFLFYTETRKKL